MMSDSCHRRRPRASSAPAPRAPTTAPPRSAPCEGGTEMQSGEKLLVEAYAAIWVILFAMVLLSWRRQRRLDERIASLEAAIEQGAAGGRAEGRRLMPNFGQMTSAHVHLHPVRADDRADRRVHPGRARRARRARQKKRRE